MRSLFAVSTAPERSTQLNRPSRSHTTQVASFAKPYALKRSVSTVAHASISPWVLSWYTLPLSEQRSEAEAEAEAEAELVHPTFERATFGASRSFCKSTYLLEKAAI